MRWYGWGTEAMAFDPADRPGLWPYAAAQLGIDAHAAALEAGRSGANRSAGSPPERTDLSTGCARHSTPHAWSDADADRLRHATGRSTSDIWRLRLGLIDAAPDCVVFPANEADVLGLIEAAQRFGVVLIPFGGGSNVAGCLDPTDRRCRMIVSVDLRRMNRVLEIDAISGLVRAEPGITRTGARSCAGTRRTDAGAFPRQLPVLHTGRLGRHQIVRDAQRRLRQHRGHGRLPCVSSHRPECWKRGPSRTPPTART